MDHPEPNLDTQLDQFLSSIPWAELIEPILPFFEGEPAKAEAFLKILQAEAHFGYGLIKPFLENRNRVLEVGSGMGLLSTFLRQQGVHITAIEPGFGGFGVSTTLARALQSLPGVASLDCLDLPAEELDPEAHGHFDLIYSVNVMEHIPALEEAMTGMAAVLAPGGVMVHTCPNYTVPYEPHFGIPLLPFIPRFTQYLLPSLQKSELWQSLNFITAGRIRRQARKLSLGVHFRPEVLYDTFRRLESDPEFLHRQSNPFVLFTFRLLRLTRALKLLQFLPAGLATPIIFELHSRQAAIKSGKPLGSSVKTD